MRRGVISERMSGTCFHADPLLVTNTRCERDGCRPFVTYDRSFEFPIVSQFRLVLERCVSEFCETTELGRDN